MTTDDQMDPDLINTKREFKKPEKKNWQTSLSQKKSIKKCVSLE
jgi:hypothetical protein